jgi:hypothetical protein
MKNTFLRFAVLLPVLAIAACDGNDSGSPTTPPTPAPPAISVTGTWNTSMLVQFRRNVDGYAGTFTCPGQMTLTQNGGTFRGFAVINPPCGASSFDVTGTVQANNEVTLNGAGPRPGAGPCPAPASLSYTGLLTPSQISVHAAANVDCPGEGEGMHHFDYVLTGFKR